MEILNPIYCLQHSTPWEYSIPQTMDFNIQRRGNIQSEIPLRLSCIFVRSWSRLLHGEPQRCNWYWNYVPAIFHSWQRCKAFVSQRIQTASGEPPSLMFNTHQKLFLRVKAVGSWGHSPLSTTERKNAWSVNVSFRYIFMPWCLIKHRNYLSPYHTFKVIKMVAATYFLIRSSLCSDKKISSSATSQSTYDNQSKKSTHPLLLPDPLIINLILNQTLYAHCLRNTEPQINRMFRFPEDHQPSSQNILQTL
jgi:hypothetical protein